MESKREDGMANMREMRSIRRESFIEAYGIKEVQDEAGSSSSSGEDNNYQLNDVQIASPTKSGRQSLSIDDIEITDIDITHKQSNANGDMDISLLEFDKSNTSNEFNNNNKDDPFKEYSTPISPPNFAGGATRRKGSHQRRMMQRLGSHKNSTSFGENRRASTGEMDASMTGSFAGSFAGSFGAMSINSFSTSNASGENVEVGNLLFVTDAEMERIMYGDDDSDKNGSSSDTDTSSTVTPTLNASLPPSSTLGTGAFSTVRLAWRRTPEQDNNNVEEVGSSFDHVQNSQEKQDSRRSIVKVESQLSDNSNISFKSKGQLVAVKIIQKSILKQMKTMSRGDNNRVQVLTAYDNIEREIATMKQLQHPNLVRLYEVIDSVESDRLHMVLEYVSLGEILSYVEGTNKYKRMRYRRKVQGLNADGYFNEKAAALYFVDILHGLAYLHRNRICHRDLKPENILLDESGVCKISDFGVAHIFEEEQSRESYILASLDDDEEIDDMLSSCEDINDEKDINKRSSNDNSNIISKRESDSALNMSSRYNRGMLKKTEGTFPFWSPEMCSKDEIGGFSGYSADVWAAGVCLYIFTTGKLPFFSTIPTDLFDLIEKGDVKYDGLDLSDDLKDLLGKLLDKDPSTRAGVGDCLKSKYCSDAREERLHQLGDMLSEKHIILSKADVATALSVTMSSEQGNHFHKVISKRFSAPATARRTTAPPQSFSAFGIPKPKSSRRKLGAETALTETTADATREYLSDNSTMSNESHHNHALHKKISKKKVGDKPKFKLKNLWRRRR